MVAQRPVKARVAGSNPAGAANGSVTQWKECNASNVEAGGSTPSRPTIVPD
jgi:hypothetical protein